jgi:hypothetical protein
MTTDAQLELFSEAVWVKTKFNNVARIKKDLEGIVEDFWTYYIELLDADDDIPKLLNRLSDKIKELEERR